MAASLRSNGVSEVKICYTVLLRRTSMEGPLLLSILVPVLFRCVLDIMEYRKHKDTLSLTNSIGTDSILPRLNIVSGCTNFSLPLDSNYSQWLDDAQNLTGTNLYQLYHRSVVFRVLNFSGKYSIRENQQQAYFPLVEHVFLS